MSQPTSVYLYYDAIETLIYVGITGRGASRNREHNQTKAWWPYVSRQEVEHYPTRVEALVREKQLIQAFYPPFNTQHNPGHVAIRAAYEALAASSPAWGDPVEEIQNLNKTLPLDVLQQTLDALVLTTRQEHAGTTRILESNERYRTVLHEGMHLGDVSAFAITAGIAVIRVNPRPGLGRIASAEGRLGFTFKPQRAWFRRIFLAPAPAVAR